MLQIRRFAKYVYEFRKKNKIKGDSEADWFIAERFCKDGFWVDQMKLRRRWEKYPRKRGTPRVTERELFSIYLINVVYSWRKNENSN